MITDDYRKAFFLGSMKDDSMEKNAALYMRKRELTELSRSSDISPEDKAASQQELREINTELLKENAPKDNLPKDNTPKENGAKYNDMAAVYEGKRSKNMPEETITPVSEEELSGSKDAAAKAFENIGKNNNGEINVQANIPSNDVLALLMK